MKMIVCDGCGKKVRRENIGTLFSGSLSGAHVVAYLCMKCKNNGALLEKMQRINDWKLALMDGEISLQDFNKKVRVLHEGGDC